MSRDMLWSWFYRAIGNEVLAEYYRHKALKKEAQNGD